MLLGVDTGGTFTDFVLIEGDRLRIHKVLSTPGAPERAILQGIDELGLQPAIAAGRLRLIHGSTVATNAALEGKGVRTVFITNRGFADLLTIGRQTRRELYNLQPVPPAPPVPDELCLETGGRLGADGDVVEPLTDAELETLAQQLRALQPQAVAINLLFSFLDDQFERRIEAIVPDGVFVSRSSAVLPEYREYERGIATWLNAWLGPRVRDYLRRLKRAVAPAPVAVMQSSGGTVDAEQAAERAVNLLLSGPAGGLAAARYVAELTGSPGLMTFDMGGTSTDVALVQGDIALTSEGHIGPWPVAVPMVDMHTIGAGGGSIAWLDSGGLLQVGPESAGADPGPACYGRGGTRATVTDANAVLGRLRPDAFLGGEMTLDLAAAHQAIAQLADPLGLTVEQTAQGIITLANEHMTRALRVISVQRGHDPAEFRLCCFGGAGGLHVCALAEALGMRRALIPSNGGVLSALGMLVAPRERQLSRSHRAALADASRAIETLSAQLAAQGRDELLAEGAKQENLQRQTSLDLCYRGQSFTLNVPWSGDPAQAAAAFHERHRERYGHAMDLPVELVTVRVACRDHRPPPALPQLPTRDPAAAEQHLELTGIGTPVALYHREAIAPGQTLTGPALIVERTATSLLAPGWQARCDVYGNLLLER